MVAVTFAQDASTQNETTQPDSAVVTNTPPEASSESLQDVQRQVKRLLPKVRPAVVAMEGGSGVIVSKDGWVVTASHVAGRPGRKIWVQLANGLRWPAVTYGSDQGADTALVKLTGHDQWPFAALGDCSKIQAGQWCLGLGYPFSFDRSKPAAARLGRVTMVSAERLVSDMPIMGGDSGGAVFNLQGQLIAVHSTIKQDIQQNHHVPVQVFVDQWSSLVAQKVVAKERELSGDGGEVDAEQAASRFGRNANEVVSVVDAVREKIEPALVRLGTAGGQNGQLDFSISSLGTIVSKDGLVVAKYSELKQPIVAKRAGGVGESIAGKLLAIDPSKDLALIKFEPAAGLPFVPISMAGREQQDAVEQSNKMAPAVKKDALSGTIVFSLLGRPEKRSEHKSTRLGTTIGVVMVEPQAFFGLDSIEFDRWGGGPFSGRRFGFGRVIAHDSVIGPQDCGGPLVGVDGQVLGINISRAMRSTSYAIPIEDVKAFVLLIRPNAKLND